MAVAQTVEGLKKWAAEFEASGKASARIGDGDGLYLEGRRGASGVGYSWVMRWRDGSVKNARGVGVDRSKGLGAYIPAATEAQRRSGAFVTLAQARTAAKKLREGFATQGRDPMSAKRAERDRLAAEAAEAATRRETAEQRAEQLQRRTVGHAVREWDKATRAALTSEKYAAQRLRRLEEYLPHIGDMPVELLTRAAVAEAHRAMKANERAETFARTSADLEKAIEWALSEGWADMANPVTGARKNIRRTKTEGRRTIPVEQVSEFWRDVCAAGAGEAYPVGARLLQLLTLTAARTREVRLMKWADVEGLDSDMPCIKVPADRMKRREAWTCYLSPAAVSILREIQQWQSEVGKELKGVKEGYVFVHLTGNYKGRIQSENAVNDLLKEIGWHGQITGHGLRKLFSTLAHDCWTYRGPNRAEAVEYSLAHNHADKVRATYDKNDFRNLRADLMRWWADHLRRTAGNRTGGGVVLEFKAA